MSRILLGTGPIVAFLNKKDANHRWACVVFDSIAPPLLTCEPVISEACFLVRRLEGGPGVVLELVRRGIVQPEAGSMPTPGPERPHPRPTRRRPHACPLLLMLTRKRLIVAGGRAARPRQQDATMLSWIIAPLQESVEA